MRTRDHARPAPAQCARGGARALWLLLVACGLAGDGCTSETIKQDLLIGSPCKTSSECGTVVFRCDEGLPGGYCTKDCLSDFDCPPEAICLQRNGSGACRAGRIAEHGRRPPADRL